MHFCCHSDTAIIGARLASILAAGTVEHLQLQFRTETLGSVRTNLNRCDVGVEWINKPMLSTSSNGSPAFDKSDTGWVML